MQHPFMKRPSVRITFVTIAVAAAAAIVIGDLVHRAAGRKLREAILTELQPVALKNCTLKRFGSANDGGYVMCENLIEPLDAAYSYGVGPNDDWGCEVSRRYDVPVHQYDCFDPARPTCDGGSFVFHNECVGDRTGYRGSHFFDTLANQIRKNGDIGRRVIIKMDIEGAEWDTLLAAPDELLASTPQIAMEMHGFDDPKIVEVLRKLKRHFYLVNLHFNNWSCTRQAAPLPAWAYQTQWVNKRIGVPDPAAPVPAPMSPLNAPDSPTWPDCQLRTSRLEP
jgi:Methyltransferase FkbM domain